VSSSLYVRQLAAEASAAEELAAAGLSNCANDRNAAASVGAHARVKHASAQRNVHISKHYAAEHAVLHLVGSAQQDRGDSCSSVLAALGAAAERGTEGCSILLKQEAV
jgi:hypothetical protein